MCSADSGVAGRAVAPPVAGINPLVGPVNLVPAIALGAAVASLALASLTTVAKRSSKRRSPAGS
ncbi:hypothetical protein C9J85_10910 [Haloferax sp. wsp5]|nr:hypothetical protein C9J85_10910 [Haloferax sp. wsp5]